MNNPKKIAKAEELDKTKNQYVEYSESYIVKFWIQEGEFWQQKTEEYFAKSKGEHEKVVSRWKNDYRKQKVKFISIIYQ